MSDHVGQQLGNYRLIRLLGRGGFANVYLGEHILLNSHAAVKILHTRLADEDLQQFVREAQTLVHLSHPHVVRILDFAIEEGTPFLVMEYAPNGTLRALHPKATRVPHKTLVSYVTQVASALQYAHDQRLVHRDVKPENMLLGTRSEVLLSDFGLAMLIPHTISASTEAMVQPLAGTSSYLAPEQLHGESRPSSDQYALGVVVYEWLCGAPPFHGSPFEIAMQHLSMPPPPLRERLPNLSPAIEEVVLRALAKEPEQRFASVQDFAAALQRACDEPPAIAPVSLSAAAVSLPVDVHPSVPALHIHLLGDFRLISGETPVTSVDVPRLQSLLAYLAMHHTAPQPRSHLAYLMWPESTDAQALTNLRNAIHRLRHTLPSADSFLRVTRQGLQWLSERPNVSWTLDVLDFEQALTRAKQAEQANDLTAKRQALAQAANLYRGDLLPSCYDEWMLPERDRLHQAFLGALEQLIELLQDERDYQGAIDAAQRLLRHDPLRETAYRHLMRLYALSGDRAAALRTYHTCVTTLERELAAQPARATREAYERLMQMGEQAAPFATPYTTVSAAPLVGRQKEWTQLEVAWHRAITGHPHLFVLSGEAGIGKSRLAEELLIRVGRQGIAAASASCYVAEGTLAYTPVSVWLQTSVFQASLATLPALWLTEVARLLPELLVQRPDLPRPDPMQEGWQRQHFFQALARATLGARQPLLLLLDDLHWCDAETLSWLHYLLRFDSQARLFLVATMRTEETTIDHPVASWLLGLQHEHLATEMALEPLNAADTASLAEQVSGGNLTATAMVNLYRETEGNPLFVVETVRAGSLKQDDGVASTERGPLPQRGSSRLPPTVQAVIAARFAQLSPLARQIAGVAAVIGREFTFNVLAHAMKDNEDALVLGLDELWQRRIVREHGGDAYDFSHDKLREAAYAALSNARRRLLHRSVAEAMESLYAPALDAHLAELAYHFYEAGNWTKAQEYAQLAGKKALALYAPRAAIEHFSRALDAVEHLSMTPSPALTRARGQAYEVLGEFSRARTDYETTLQIAHAIGERETEWEALLHLGMLWTGRDYERSGAYFQRAFELARAMGHPSTLARSLNRVGNWHLNLERPQEALRHHQEALTIFQELQDPHGTAETLDLLGMTSYLGGDLVGGTIYYEEAVALFRQLDDRQGLTSSLATLTFRVANYQTDTMISAPTRLAEVVSDGERGLQIAREIGQRSAEAYALICLGFCQGPRGDYAHALSLAQEGLGIAEGIEHRQWMTAAHCALGTLYRDLLMPSMARQHLEQALALAQETSSWHRIRTATGYLASTYILQNELEQAESILRNALDPSTPAQTLGQRLAWFAQAELALARGNPVLTLQIADQLIVSAANISGTRIIPRLWKLRGEALTLLNQRAEAEALLQSAQEEAHAQGSQSLLWRIHLTLGNLYHAQQRYPEAKDAFLAGRTIIEELAAKLPSESLRNQFLSSAVAQIPSGLH